MNEEKPVNILEYLWGVRVCAAWGLLVAVIVGVSGLLLTRTTDESQRAVLLLSVQPAASSDQAAAVRQSSLFASSILSVSRLVPTEDVLAPVAQKTGQKVEDLLKRTTSRVPASTRLIEISYVGTTPEEATSTLSAIGDSVIDQVSRSAAFSTGDLAIKLEVQQPASTELNPGLVVELETVSKATTAGSSSMLRLALVAFGALLAGVATAAVLIVRRRKKQAVALEPHGD